MNEEIKGKNVKSMTKAELLLHIEALEAKAEEIKKLVKLDMDFKETPKEKSAKDKKQAQKDFIKRMTNGRWTSQKKFDEYIETQQKALRMPV